jgi:hypothetical protein
MTAMIVSRAPRLRRFNIETPAQKSGLGRVTRTTAVAVKYTAREPLRAALTRTGSDQNEKEGV